MKLTPEEVERERKAFEAYMLTLCWVDKTLLRQHEGLYLNSTVQHQWDGWLARAEQAESDARVIATLTDLARYHGCTSRTIAYHANAAKARKGE